MNRPKHPTYVERLLSSIERSSSDERELVLDFRERVHGVRDPEHVAWMYDAQPGADFAGSPLWTWHHHGRVEAHQGAIRTVLRLGEVERQLSWAVDLVVDPDHRARGIGAVLPKQVIAEVDVVAGTEVSEEAQKSLSRSGWDHLGTIPLWVRPLKPSTVIRRRSQRLSVRLAGPIVGLGLGARRYFARLRALGYSLQPIDSFDETAERIWNDTKDSWPLIARRNYEWLRWRWDRNADVEHRTYWLQKSGTPVGWVVLEAREHNGLDAGFISDLLCTPDHLQALLAVCVEEFYAQQRDVVYCMFSAPGASRPLKRNGFLKRDSGLTMMVYADKLRARERSLVTDKDMWFLTAGDSNLDRVRLMPHSSLGTY